MARPGLGRVFALVRSRLELLSGHVAPLKLRASTIADEARAHLARASQRTADTASCVHERWKSGGALALREDARECLERMRERLQASAWWDWRPRPWERYKALLTEQPMLCNSLTAGALYGTGDFIAQHLEKRLGIESHGKDCYNVPRTLRMVIFGLFLAGPTYCKWYPQLQKMTVAYRGRYEPIRVGVYRLPFFRREDLKEPSERAVEVAVKVMVENLFFQPPFLTLYFMVMGALEGISFSKVYDKTRQNFHDTWGLAMMVWVPVQAVNFWFLPVYLQASFTQLVNMVWKVGLSLFYHSRDRSRDHELRVATEGAAAEAPPVEKEGRLEEQVALLWLRVEAILARQQSEAKDVAALRAQLREQHTALRQQTEVLAVLAAQAELQRSEIEAPLRGLRRQLDEQAVYIGRQAEELARLRAALAQGGDVQGGKDAQVGSPPGQS
mmetsp:Transcript_22060/g.66272  ORF Transcript_22060/g.66272 Transcript_22060/m.66272 type:complete len:442 (+) Transcript_22060:71-1396(+)